MAFKVTIVDSEVNPIPGTITWLDESGNAVRFPTQQVPITGATFDDGLRASGLLIVVESPGYTSYQAPADYLSDETNIRLDKKSNILLILIAAAVGGYLLKQIIG